MTALQSPWSTSLSPPEPAVWLFQTGCQFEVYNTKLPSVCIAALVAPEPTVPVAHSGLLPW
jgi:hypothetical protein